MLVGGFLGDYVKGRLEGQFAPDIERGIRLHRAIDRFTDQHDIVRRSQSRFDPRFRRYAGIMTDIIFDHLLARDFAQYNDTPLEDFSREVLGVVVEHTRLLPPDAAAAANRMHEMNSLAGHDSELFIERSFSFLSRRLTRANPLNEAFDECRPHLPALRGDLSEFYPVLTEFCDTWKKTH